MNKNNQTINNPEIDDNSDSDLDFDNIYIPEYNNDDYIPYTENEKLIETLYCIDYNTRCPIHIVYPTDLIENGYGYSITNEDETIKREQLNEFTSILQECIEYVINKLYDKLIQVTEKKQWNDESAVNHAEILSLILAREEAYSGIYGDHEINDHIHIAIYMNDNYSEMLKIIQLTGYQQLFEQQIKEYVSQQFIYKLMEYPETVDPQQLQIHDSSNFNIKMAGNRYSSLIEYISKQQNEIYTWIKKNWENRINYKNLYTQKTNFKEKLSELPEFNYFQTKSEYTNWNQLHLPKCKILQRCEMPYGLQILKNEEQLEPQKSPNVSSKQIQEFIKVLQLKTNKNKIVIGENEFKGLLFSLGTAKYYNEYYSQYITQLQSTVVKQPQKPIFPLIQIQKLLDDKMIPIETTSNQYKETIKQIFQTIKNTFNDFLNNNIQESNDIFFLYQLIHWSIEQYIKQQELINKPQQRKALVIHGPSNLGKTACINTIFNKNYVHSAIIDCNHGTD